MHRNAGGLWFSNNWVNGKTVMTNIFGGDVSETGSATLALITNAARGEENTTLAKEEEKPLILTELITKVWPNPSESFFNINVKLKTAKMSLR